LLAGYARRSENLFSFSNRMGSHVERSEAWSGKSPRLAHNAHRGFHEKAKIVKRQTWLPRSAGAGSVGSPTTLESS
jgi:hypothetical protein